VKGKEERDGRREEETKGKGRGEGLRPPTIY